MRYMLKSEKHTCTGGWWAKRVLRREQCLSSMNCPKWNIPIDVSMKHIPYETEYPIDCKERCDRI